MGGVNEASYAMNMIPIVIMWVEIDSGTQKQTELVKQKGSTVLTPLPLYI